VAVFLFVGSDEKSRETVGSRPDSRLHFLWIAKKTKQKKLFHCVEHVGCRAAVRLMAEA
jgi:hypothetical protein